MNKHERLLVLREVLDRHAERTQNDPVNRCDGCGGLIPDRIIHTPRRTVLEADWCRCRRNSGGIA